MKKAIFLLGFLFVLSSTVFVVSNFKEKYDAQLQPQFTTTKYSADEVIEIKYGRILNLEKDLIAGLRYYSTRCNLYKTIILIGNAIILLMLSFFALKKAN